MVIFKLCWILWLAALNESLNAVNGLPTSVSLFQYKSVHSDPGKRGASGHFFRVTYNLFVESSPVSVHAPTVYFIIFYFGIIVAHF